MGLRFDDPKYDVEILSLSHGTESAPVCQRLTVLICLSTAVVVSEPSRHCGRVNTGLNAGCEAAKVIMDQCSHPCSCASFGCFFPSQPSQFHHLNDTPVRHGIERYQRSSIHLLQSEELLRIDSHIVGVGRGRTRNVNIGAEDVRCALQQPSLWPCQHEVISLP